LVPPPIKTLLNRIFENVLFEKNTTLVFHLSQIACRVLDKLNLHFWQKRHFWIFSALRESIIQSCQRALNSEQHTKNHIITPGSSLFSNFITKKCTFFKQ
jgi:hypothetical protein